MNSNRHTQRPKLFFTGGQCAATANRRLQVVTKRRILKVTVYVSSSLSLMSSHISAILDDIS